MNKKLKIGVTIIVISLSFLLATKVYATTGTTINDTTRLRKKASTNSDVVELISKNENVEIDSEDGDWYKVSYKSSDGKTLTGYVRKDLLDVESTEQEETTTEVKENSEEQSKEENENQDNSAEASELEEQAEVQEGITEKQELELKNDTEVQLLPLVFSSKTGEIAKNTKITVTEVVGNWCYIESDSQEGWIMTSKIEASQISTEQNKTENKDENKKEEDKKEENNAKEKKTTTKGTKLYVSTSTLNLREKADTSSRILEQLEQNDEVTVVETVDNKWSKVTINGVTGYVATQYLSKEKSKEVSSRSSDDRKESKKENKENTNNTTNSTDNSNNTNNSNKTTTKKETVESTQKSEEKTENTESAKSTSKVTGADVVAYAKKFLGYKYVYGTAGPNTFDCSGFTSYVYKHFGYTLSRTSSDQRSNGTAVKKANLQAGDIVCFSGHVGIYIGDGKFIHAANSKKGVIISSLSESYYSKKYITARRILN